MPCHTHAREEWKCICIFELGEDDVVFHMMGEPQETRHLVMREMRKLLFHQAGQYIQALEPKIIRSFGGYGRRKSNLR